MSDYLKYLRYKKLGLIPDPEKKAYKIPLKAVKRLSEEKLYAKKKKAYMIDHIKCEVKGCNQVSTELHHKKGRIGKLLYNEKYFMAVCHACHRKITDDSDWAIKQGYSISKFKK